MAQDLAQKIKTGDIFVKIEAVKPGFINFTLAPEYLHGQIAEILTMGEKYGELDGFTPYSCVIKTKREEAKNIAAAILSSNLPVDDILIDEIDVDDVIREIFGK